MSNYDDRSGYFFARDLQHSYAYTSSPGLRVIHKPQINVHLLEYGNEEQRSTAADRPWLCDLVPYLGIVALGVRLRATHKPEYWSERA